MVAVTYLDDYRISECEREIKEFPELDGLLQEIKNLNNKDWLVSIRQMSNPRFFGFKKDKINLFCLYADINSGEWQIINTPYGHWIKYQEMMCLLSGYIMGFSDVKRN